MRFRFPLRTPRLLLTLSVLALAASACAGDDPEPAGSDVAESVIATVDATVGAGDAAPATTIPPGCRLERTEDEYGFPVDVIVCDGEAPPTTRGPDLAFVDWAGGEEAERLAVLIRDALVIGGGCADGTTLRELEVAASTAPVDVQPSLELVASELAQASQFCEADPALWERHLRLAVAALEDFVRVADAARVGTAEEADDG